MARTALKNKAAAGKRKLALARAQGRKMKLATRVYNRCPLSGRMHGYMSKFNLVRHCVREPTRQTSVPGVAMSPWPPPS